MRFLNRVFGWLRPPKTLQDVLRKHSIEDSNAISDCPDGWLHLVDQCFYDLIANGWNRQLFQVKQKFGGLRVYINCDDPEYKLMHIITNYENQSLVTCGVCGNFATKEGLALPKCSIHK